MTSAWGGQIKHDFRVFLDEINLESVHLAKQVACPSVGEHCPVR